MILWFIFYLYVYCFGLYISILSNGVFQEIAIIETIIIKEEAVGADITAAIILGETVAIIKEFL